MLPNPERSFCELILPNPGTSVSTGFIPAGVVLVRINGDCSMAIVYLRFVSFRPPAACLLGCQASSWGLVHCTLGRDARYYAQGALASMALAIKRRKSSIRGGAAPLVGPDWLARAGSRKQTNMSVTQYMSQSKQTYIRTHGYACSNFQVSSFPSKIVSCDLLVDAKLSRINKFTCVTIYRVKYMVI